MTAQVLTTGATGFLARHVIPAVLEEGAEVRATSRGPRPGWLDPAVAYVRADLTEDALEELVSGVSHVVHLAGASSSRSSEAEMQRVNVTGTARLAEAILRKAPEARFVYVSSTSVYGEEVQLPLPVREDGPLMPSRPYGKAKLGAERAVADASSEGLRAVVVRPVTVFGPYNTKLVASAILDASIERAAGARELELPASAVELRLLHAHDAARALVHLGMGCGDEVLGRAFNLCLPQFPTSHQVGAAIARALGMEPRIVGISEDPGLTQARRQAEWERLVGSGGLLPEILLGKSRLALLTRPNPNNRLSLEALLATGFAFRHTDLDAEVAELVDWCTAQRWIV